MLNSPSSGSSLGVKRRVCIREYGFLVEGSNVPVVDGTESNVTCLSKSAFAYLRSLIQDEPRDTDFGPFLKLTTYKRQTALKVQNYVGVMQTPCGTLIEVLPKLYSGEQETKEKTRYQLIKMLRCLRNSPFKKADRADIRDAQMPLLEVYISQFLALTNQLIKRGIRSDYIRVQKNAKFLKGRLLVSQQIRKNAMHPEQFAIECDEYLVNRPANRLIRSTLEKVKRASQSAHNLRLSRELCFVFEEVPESNDVSADFKRVKVNRGMGYYQDVLSWCQLILNGLGPTASSGTFNTLSLLYPMERIFEDYVSHCLRKTVGVDFGEGATIKTQASKHSLVEDHDGSKIFNLRPDLMVMKDKRPILVMDTKWKLIDGSDRRNKYGVSQVDMYQLYAYGHKYLKNNEHKELMLIYPKTEKFQEPLSDFRYEDGFILKVVPFDFDTDSLIV